MGIKNLPWKKIAWIVFSGIFVVLVGIFGPIKDWNWLLGGIKNSLSFLFSPIGRDAILFLLIGIILYVLKINSMSKLKRERTYIGFSKMKKAERKKQLKEEYKVILQHLIQRNHYGDHRSSILRVYKEQYPDEGELELGITLKELQRLGYITQENTGGGFFIRITDRACEKLSE